MNIKKSLYAQPQAAIKSKADDYMSSYVSFLMESSREGMTPSVL